MIQKKVCMLGAFAVGKTSLVARFVSSIFTDKYHSTVGVKVDKKQLRIGEHDVNLMLWDLAGEDEFNKVQGTYLRGSSGYLLVMDATRRATLDTALVLHERARGVAGSVPWILVINKIDLEADLDLDEDRLSRLAQDGWTVIRSSAKTGQGVEEAFHTLAERMITAAGA